MLVLLDLSMLPVRAYLCERPVRGCGEAHIADGLGQGRGLWPREWHHSLRAPTTDDVEVLMTSTREPLVLVTGATGRIGRGVVDLLIDAGVPVRALTRRSEAAATLPANVEVVAPATSPCLSHSTRRCKV